jgi:hypothetical protein
LCLLFFWQLFSCVIFLREQVGFNHGRILTMNKVKLFSGLFILSFVSAAYSYFPAVFSAGKTLVLYDAASGDIPSTSLMSFTDFPPGVALPMFSEGATVVDTTISGTDTYAGWVASEVTTPGFPILDQAVDVRVNFTVQVDSEAHTNNDRAGFSIIILDKDAKGIELSFWENEIWVKSDEGTGGLFKHGEGVAFGTSTLTDYQVLFMGNVYTLTANAQPLLTGPLRDYSAFAGFPDPYQTPNFLFLGDNTTSAQARFRLRFLSVTGMEPVVPTNTGAIPLPTASSTSQPQLTATSNPSLSPSKPIFELCPSGWLVGFVAIVSTMLIKKGGRHRTNRF